ncbi:nuclear transport factor 2 family protein [Lentzea sp. NPDC051213]|uniref:nuclear transport factor 2 family protein n=1 Tax=Lentzea sp. NPDC051213 TaxID=3364126 RepID=UPI0037B2D7BD
MARTAAEIVENVRRMVAGEEGHEAFADMFAADGVMAYRFPVPGQPEEIKGRTEIRAWFDHTRGANVRSKIEIQSVEAICRLTDDPEVAVSEITHRGWSALKQADYTFTAIAIMRIRDGEILRYDDYMNPLLLSELLGIGSAEPAH